MRGLSGIGGELTRQEEKGYSIASATANLGNGEFQGTFQTDKALYNRLPVVIDLDYQMFQPTEEDEMLRDRLREADPKVKLAPIRDISDKILAAHREISVSSANPGLEALAVSSFLRFGLKNCQRDKKEGGGGVKEKVWPLQCQDCTHNSKGEALCSLVRAPVGRTLEATRKYAVALDYLAKLKNPKQRVDAVDLMFKAFELCGAYQHVLNSGVLRTKYTEQNPKMMAEVVQRLKKDFRDNEDYIMSSLEEAQKEGRVTEFFKYKGKVGPVDSLDSEERKKVKIITPFHDNREIGLGYVGKEIDFHMKVNEARGKKEE